MSSAVPASTSALAIVFNVELSVTALAAAVLAALCVGLWVHARRIRLRALGADGVNDGDTAGPPTAADAVAQPIGNTESLLDRLRRVLHELVTMPYEYRIVVGVTTAVFAGQTLLLALPSLGAPPRWWLAETTSASAQPRPVDIS